MDKGKIDIINSLIKEIEKKNLDLEKYLKNVEFPSRNDMLKDIIRDIVLKNQFLEELEIPVEKIYKSAKKKEKLIQDVVNDIISNIKNNKSKKVIFLKEFLDLFEEISESDKNVILQSLKDEKIENLQKKMFSLVEMFNLKV